MSSSTVPRRRDRRVNVYNPSHRNDVVQAFGSFYTFAPHAVGKCLCAPHNQPGREENVGIHSVLEFPKNEKLEPEFDKPRKVGAEGDLTADRVAEFIVSDECRGAKHFVILEGTPAEIEELKRVADARYVGAYLEKVESSIASWENYVSKFRTENPSSVAPSMPKDVQEDYAFRARHREAMKKRKAHVCLICSLDTDDRAEYVKHYAEEHPNAPQPTADGGAPPLVDYDDDDEGEGKSKNRLTPGLGRKMLARAEAAGLALSVADVKGLKHDDFDVYQDIEVRMDEAKAAAKVAREKAIEEQRAAKAAAEKAKAATPAT